MTASIINQTATSVTIQVTIPLASTMLNSEDTIQSVLNEAGQLATAAALKSFDSDGRPMEHDGQRWTSKGQSPKQYQSPYGPIEVERHTYQPSQGGEIYCPLEVDGRIIGTATPRFAKQLSHKYAEMSSGRVVADLAENHGRLVARSFVQTVAETVGSIAQAKEEVWHYQTPKLSSPVATISIGLDGTSVVLSQQGNRQAMVGTISLHDQHGDRLHTTYIGAAPEYGRATFLARMEREIEHVMGLYPEAHRQGLADGAAENWTFLAPYTHTQVLDFYHATGYLKLMAKVLYPRSPKQREQWMDEQAHRLKHEAGTAPALLAEWQRIDPNQLSAAGQAALHTSISYFTHHHHHMNYAQTRQANRPIGSGVTESACKLMVKQRLCGAGMQWKDRGATMVLSLRTLSYTVGRWQQFWSKINRYGVPA